MKLTKWVIGLLLLAPGGAWASSVLQVPFDQMVRSSEFVFEGRVVDKRAETNRQGVIHTYVTFAIADVLKGNYSKSEIVLQYLGGTVGGLSMGVPDIVPPGVGERGIYFAETPGRALVHPFYGWDQGHFVVETDTGRADRVFSRSKKPITGFKEQIIKNGTLSNGVAAGLSTGEPGQTSEAVGLADFKMKIREVVNRR
jgi:hypothetical protein